MSSTNINNAAPSKTSLKNSRIARAGIAILATALLASGCAYEDFGDSEGWEEIEDMGLSVVGAGSDRMPEDSGFVKLDVDMSGLPEGDISVNVQLSGTDPVHHGSVKVSGHHAANSNVAHIFTPPYCVEQDAKFWVNSGEEWVLVDYFMEICLSYDPATGEWSASGVAAPKPSE